MQTLPAGPTPRLALIDVQERLLPAMHEGEALLSQWKLLLGGAALLGWPRIVTEQYPKGLGRTVPALAGDPALAGVPVLEKTAFSCLGAPGFAEWAAAGGRVVLAGIEAHVCVHQTASDLLARGIAVDLVEDAVTSRRASDRDIALRDLRHRGARLVSVEMILFAGMGDAKHPAFKEMSRLVKEHS